VAEFAEFKVVS